MSETSGSSKRNIGEDSGAGAADKYKNSKRVAMDSFENVQLDALDLRKKSRSGTVDLCENSGSGPIDLCTKSKHDITDVHEASRIDVGQHKISGSPVVTSKKSKAPVVDTGEKSVIDKVKVYRNPRCINTVCLAQSSGSGALVVNKNPVSSAVDMRTYSKKSGYNAIDVAKNSQDATRKPLLENPVTLGSSVAESRSVAGNICAGRSLASDVDVEENVSASVGSVSKTVVAQVEGMDQTSEVSASSAGESSRVPTVDVNERIGASVEDRSESVGENSHVVGGSRVHCERRPRKRVRFSEDKQRRSDRLRKTSSSLHGRIAKPIYIAKWTNSDKEKILAAFKKYGVRNISKLEEAVGTKNHESIKDFIHIRFRTTHIAFSVKKPMKKTGQTAMKAKRMLKAPIECWLQKAEEAQSGMDYSNLLSTTFAYIANYESHPDPETCGGVNYRAIYSYLATLLRGEPPRDLSAKDSQKVLELINALADNMKLLNLAKERHFLETYSRLPSKTGSPVRKYGGKKKQETSGTADEDYMKMLLQLKKINGMNLLQIPLEFCKTTIKI